MKQFVRSMTLNRFVQGSFLFTVSNFLVGFLNYLFNVGTARALGPEGYSDIVALFSYVTIFSIPVGVLTTFLIQKIGAATDVHQYAQAARYWLISKIQRWWFLLVIFLLITPFIPQLTNLSPVTAYVLPLMIIFAFLAAFYNGALQGLHLFVWFSVINIVATVIKLAGAGAALWWMNEVYIIIVFLVISNLVYVVMSQMAFTKVVTSSATHIGMISKRIVDILRDKQLWYTIAMTGALALLNNVDIIYVKKMFSAEEAGIYSAWSLFAKIILYALGPLMTVSFIFFSSKKQEKYHHLFFISSLILLAGIGFGLMLIYGGYSRRVVELIFGDQYLSVIPYIEWAAFFGTGYVIMMFINYYYLSRNSKMTLVPAILLPFYLIALVVYADEIVKVMYLNTAYAFIAVTIFLLAYFKDRFLHLIKLFT